MTPESAAFLRSKFDTICLLGLAVLFIFVLVWVDKHGNSDFEKWLETAAAGVLGAFVGLTTAARQAWTKPNGNGGANGAGPDGVQTSANVPNWPGKPKP